MRLLTDEADIPGDEVRSVCSNGDDSRLIRGDDDRDGDEAAVDATEYAAGLFTGGFS